MIVIGRPARRACGAAWTCANGWGGDRERTSMLDTKNGRFSKRPGSSSRVGRVRAAQLLRSRPRLVCAHLPAQQQAIIAGHIHAHARPAAQLARSRQREAKVNGMRVMENRRGGAELCCIQKMPEREGRRARSRFSSFFNVAAIGGKSPRASIGSSQPMRRGLTSQAFRRVRLSDRGHPTRSPNIVNNTMPSPTPRVSAIGADRVAAARLPLVTARCMRRDRHGDRTRGTNLGRSPPCLGGPVG